MSATMFQRKSCFWRRSPGLMLDSSPRIFAVPLWISPFRSFSTSNLHFCCIKWNSSRWYHKSRLFWIGLTNCTLSRAAKEMAVFVRWLLYGDAVTGCKTSIKNGWSMSWLMFKILLLHLRNEVPPPYLLTVRSDREKALELIFSPL